MTEAPNRPRPSPAGSAFARRLAVVLCRPENAENVGLAARAMKNTGFGELRLVLDRPLDSIAHKTAVHAGTIIDRARVFPDLEEAVADLHLVFAGTAKSRKNFEVLAFEDALDRMLAAPLSARVGLLFGNERTGLTSEELRRSNFRFTIPQAARQPSYNLAAAVLLTLFALFTRSPTLPRLERRGYERSPAFQGGDEKRGSGLTPNKPRHSCRGVEGLTRSGAAVPTRARPGRTPFTRREMETFRRVFIRKMEERGFIHSTNRTHMEERISDLLGRLALTAEDGALFLALFSKGSTAG
ncbi:MAG: RNA methyltransferase [Candidatus Aminicenantes bacterium]|nr:RNA methyltransferase [Candidatus Aminicenantes bacterium]